VNRIELIQSLLGPLASREDAEAVGVVLDEAGYRDSVPADLFRVDYTPTADDLLAVFNEFSDSRKADLMHCAVVLAASD
jgi:hypothetical protein